MFLIFLCQGGYFFTLVRLNVFVSLSARLHKKVYFLETWMGDGSQPRIDLLLGQRLDTVHELTTKSQRQRVSYNKARGEVGFHYTVESCTVCFLVQGKDKFKRHFYQPLIMLIFYVHAN